MFRLKAIAYTIFVLTLFAAFHLLHMKDMVSYAAINIFFLAASPISLIYPNILSYLLVCLSWIILYPLFIFIYKVDPLNAALPIMVLNGLQIGFLQYKAVTVADQKEWEFKVKSQGDDKKNILGEFEKLSGLENDMKEKELAIVNLYEITRKISENLRFNEIFSVFSVFLKESFRFRRCILLILDWQDSVAHLDRRYSVWQGEAKAASENMALYDRLIELFLGSPKELRISRVASEQAFRNLGIEDAEIETFFAIPLLSERKLVGILAVENLPNDEIEKFLILSAQFALEIKKVLLYETVERLAITDSLTGLYTRRYFIERLNEELNRSKRYKFKFAFLMIDIDDFKRCNDAYGHLVGDVVLKTTADIMRQNVREIDIVSRYGGEEFTILLPETNGDSALLVAERLRTKIEGNVFKAYDERLKVTISVGIAIYPDDARQAQNLIEKSDTALYAAKSSGKNIVCEYKKEYNKEL